MHVQLTGVRLSIFTYKLGLFIFSQTVNLSHTLFQQLLPKNKM